MMRNRMFFVLNVFVLVLCCGSGCGALVTRSYEPSIKFSDAIVYHGVIGDMNAIVYAWDVGNSKGDYFFPAMITTGGMVDIPFSFILDSILVPIDLYQYNNYINSKINSDVQ